VRTAKSAVVRIIVAPDINRVLTGYCKVSHNLFEFTTADENGGLGGSVGTDLRAATSLDQEVAAQERCSHIKTAFS
jgi:hypothetical protein